MNLSRMDHSALIVHSRTILFKTLFRLFELARRVRARLQGRRYKHYHGPLWRQIVTPLFGECPRLCVDAFGQRLYVRPTQLNDMIALVGRSEENQVYELVNSLQEGEVFLDAGANIGQYSVLAATKVGPRGIVVAVEPQPQNLQVLQMNIEARKLAQIRTCPVALGNKPGTANLLSTPDDLSVTSLNSSWVDAMSGKTIDKRITTVEVKTLTQLVEELELDHVDLLKVDVEGFELPVIEGGLEVFKSGRIWKLICEIHSPGTAKTIAEWLRHGGYRIHNQVDDMSSCIVASLPDSNYKMCLPNGTVTG